MIEIIIIDDHKMFIDGVKSFLKDDENINVIGAVTSGIEALALLKTMTPDVILLDVHMPEMDGEEAMEAIQELYPNLKILAVTMSDTSADLQRMIHNGADGYLLKDKGKEELINAVHQVYQGNRYIPLDLVMKLIPPPKKKKARLTTREHEILCLIKKGMSDKQIAEHLNIAGVTVEAHSRNMRKKTKTNNRMQLVNYAEENGLL
jgi:DNA-binding NarL/FixJ family response regulator